MQKFAFYSFICLEYLMWSFQGNVVMKRAVPQTDKAAWPLIATQEGTQVVRFICLDSLYNCQMAAHSSPLRTYGQIPGLELGAHKH